jgi:glutamine amidotransferase
MILHRLDDVLIDPDHCIAKQVHDHYLPFLDTFEKSTTKEDTERQIAMRNKARLKLIYVAAC